MTCLCTSDVPALDTDPLCSVMDSSIGPTSVAGPIALKQPRGMGAPAWRVVFFFGRCEQP